MFSKKEIFSIVSVSVVIGTVVSLDVPTIEEWQGFILTALAVSFLAITINAIAKKIMAHYFDSEIEISTWQFKRFMWMTKKSIYGHKPHQKLKSIFPAGFFMPLIVKFLSIGLLNWMACLTFNAKGTIYRTSKRWGMYQYADITENETAWIAFIGILANLTLAILGYMVNMPLFARVNLVYAFYNTIPISNLDGTKMFFGKATLWWAAAILTSIGVVMSMVIA